MRVLFRADASVQIGSGHVMRCLTLARAMRAQGAEVMFACRDLPGLPAALLAQAGLPLILLPATQDWQQDLAALQSALADSPDFDWIIVDHYGLDARWESGARALARRIMPIDDLADRPHDADVLLDQNLGAAAERYRSLLPAACRVFLGPEYALLREEFLAEPLPLNKDLRHVLVNFGGSDPGGETFKALEALEAFSDIHVEIVAGVANPAWARLQQRVAGHEQWRLHHHVADFAALLRQADLAIGAGGGSCWERAALGLPSVCIAIAENQLSGAQHLAEQGAHLYLGPSATVTAAHIAAALVLLRQSPQLRHSLARRSRELGAGQGRGKLLAALWQPYLHLRAATPDDARLLYDGRNSEEVRRQSRDASPIGWPEHLRWLQAVLADENRALLVAEAGGQALGVLRFDRLTEEGGASPREVEVSIYLLPGQYGKGWGLALLEAGRQWLRRHWPQLDKIRADVLPGNPASLALFRKAGYRQLTCHFEYDLQESRDADISNR